VTTGLVLLLLVVNAFVCRKLFVTEYTQHMESIEGAYIGISRYLMTHWGDLSWFRLWYCGIPFQNSYPPVFHMAVALVAGAFRISPALAHHVVGAFVYCLGPVTLFLLCYRLSRRRTMSFVAALAYSLITPSAFFIPSMISDLGSRWHPRRLQGLVAYGDGPHVAAVALLPLAILALNFALERRTPLRVCWAALMLVLVVLTNWLGAFSLALAIGAYLLANWGDRLWMKRILWSAAIGALAFAFAFPWIPPSTVAAVQRNAQYVIGHYPVGKSQAAAAALLAAAALVFSWWFAKLRLPCIHRFGALFLLFTAALILPSEWLHFDLMPQPFRYQLEFDMAAIIVLVFSIGSFWERIPVRFRHALVIAILCAAVLQLRVYNRFARHLIRPIRIESTVEYESAHWLDRHLHNQRVFATGSVQFWLNAFAGNSQIGGGFGQGMTNAEIPVVHFGIPYMEHDGSIAAMWLRLFGAQAVIVSGPQGRDSYNWAWRDPRKFIGVLPEIWRDGDDAIYGLSQRTTSLAHVIPLAHIVARAPVNVVDLAPVQPLAADLQSAALPPASFEWTSPHEAVIRTNITPGQALFIQISYHAGWKAMANGISRPVRPDGLGLMLVEPRCAGHRRRGGARCSSPDYLQARPCSSLFSGPLTGSPDAGVRNQLLPERSSKTRTRAAESGSHGVAKMGLMWLCAALCCSFLFQAASPAPVDWQAEGMKLLEAKNYPAAVDALSKAAASDPQNFAIHFNLALAYSLDDKDPQAIAEYRKTLELKPGLEPAITNLGILLLRNKDAAAAIPLLRQSHRLKSADARIATYLGDALLAQTQLPEAADAYTSALEADPKSAAAESGLGRVLLQQNQLQQAAEHLRKAVDLDASYKDVLLELGEAYERAGQAKDAVAIYSQFPDNAAAQERAGELLLEAGDGAAAVPLLERAVQTSPTSANRLALATAHFKTKEYDKGLAVLDAAITADPRNYELRMAAGRALRDEKKFPQAATQFVAAAQLKPDAVRPWSELAGVAVLAESYPQALAALDKVKALGGETSSHLYLRAIILDKLRQLQPALDAYQAFLATSGGKYPDEEFKARQRSRIIKRELSKR
jgi:tetratricopeptide (TPR) repeat protein